MPRPSFRALGGAQLDSLPAGVYCANSEGRFLYCNDVARSIFGLPADAKDITQYSIIDTYADPEERCRLLELMRRNSGRLLNQPIELDVGGRTVIVLDSCMYVPAARGGEEDVLGVICDVTDSMEKKRLWEQLPVAVYEVGEDNIFRRANQRVADILGYSKSGQLFGKDITKHYLRPEEAKQFAEEVRSEGRVSNKIIDMVRADGTPIIVQVSAERLTKKGNPDGRFGAFTDVTKSQKVAQALGRLPTGYYEVEGDGKDGRISYCNEAFAKMFGYDSSHEMINRVRAADLHASDEVWEAYMVALQRADAANKALEDYKLQTKRRDGSRFWVAIDCRIEKDARGRAIGREGTLRDITKQVELKETVDGLQGKLDALTHDMDVLVHRYVSPMMRLKAGLQVEESMLVATRPNSATPTGTTTLTERWAGKLEQALGAACSSLEEGGSGNEGLREELSRIRNVLTHRRFRGRPVLEDIETRKAAMNANNALVRHANSLRAHPALRELRTCAAAVIDQEVIRNTRRLLSQIAEVYTAIESMRVHFSRSDVDYDFQDEDITALLDSVLDTYAAYAAEKGLSFYVDAPPKLTIQVAGTHFLRALSNVVINAIKYSYRREDGHIDIRVKDEASSVLVCFTNYGVPIAKEEISSAILLQYGKRGRFSRDLNRMGSGVGLSDVAETMRQHKGGVAIESHPAPRGATEDDYTVPFLTTVSIWLPK